MLDKPKKAAVSSLQQGGEMSERHAKRDFLIAAGALHSHPERVKADLFHQHRFFDPLDKVQVKYEMLRAHAVDGEAVTDVAQAFGFSRQTFYTTAAAFWEVGILGLTEEKRGRRGPLKMKPGDREWVEGLGLRDPDLSGRQIAERLRIERGVSVHRRTIERLLARGGKKTAEGGCSEALEAVRKGEAQPLPFLQAGGEGQDRYEALRKFILLPVLQRPRTSPICFDLRRYERHGLLSFLARDPVGESWGACTRDSFEVHVVPVGTSNARHGWAQLLDFLGHMVTATEGGKNDARCAVRPCLDRNAGEGTDDSEPAGKYRAVR